MIVKLLTEHHLEFLSLKGSCTGSSESTHVVGNHMSRLNYYHLCATCGDRTMVGKRIFISNKEFA